MTSGSLWNYYRDKVNDDENENNAANNWINKRINNNKMITSKSFEYKSNSNSILDAEFIIPWKYLSNACGPLDLILINCEIELNLTWSKYV